MQSNVAIETAPAAHAAFSLERISRRSLFEPLGVLLLTILGFLVMGYHPGLEDDAIYLAAVKADLNPALFPYNAAFFRLQVQATFFDRWMALFVRSTRMPVAWAELVWQFIALFLILWAVKMIANRLFAEETARWAAVALVAAVFTLPVAGTALYMADQHLHPRSLATAFILLATWRVLDRRFWQAVPLLLVACLLHPLMGAMGISFCIFLTLAMRWAARARSFSGSPAMLLAPGWVFEKATPSWRQALDTRTYYYLYQWTWYEWLGAIGPLIFFLVIWRVSREKGDLLLARFSLAVFCYGVFHQVLAMALLWPRSLVRVTPWQPMRYLHLVYFFFVLVAGGLIGKYLLKRSAWRWAVFLLLAGSCMFAWQRVEFRASQHLELPGRKPANEWLQAFSWIRQNTPVNAYFALDPHYMDAPGEDYHGFRPLAERSELADTVKDAAAVTQVPELGPVWATQVDALAGWPQFTLADFERLKAQFGVDWALVSYPAPQGLPCPWHSKTVAVCTIP